MKKYLLFALTTLLLGFASCSDDDEDFVPDTNYVTLDLSTFDLSDGLAGNGGKYWSGTYSDAESFSSGIFTFTHFGMDGYWQGYTVSNSTDNADYGQGSSEGWVPNQWGCMAKKGAVGDNYLIQYGGYINQGLIDEGEFKESFPTWIEINSTDRYKAVSISLCNSPWPYYGILNGDGFARPFVDGDYFLVNIYGVTADKKIKPTPVTHYLADYRDGKKVMSDKWEKVDLSSLGEVKYLLFQLVSTDSGDWGPNTALYLCLDALTVDKIIN